VLVSPAVGPPTTATRIYYSGFSPLEPVDLYLDTGDIALSSASATGAGNPPVTIPAATRPGVHFITAVGRRSLNSAQANFTVQSSWPQFGFTPTHKGKNRYENVLSSSTVIDLDQAWETTPVFLNMDSTPAIVNGIVYCGFADNTVRAFDEITGALKWTYTTGGNAAYSSPAASNGIVYVGSGDYYLYALDAVTGALKWRYATGGVIYDSPNVVNGIVYFGSYDDKVYAVNATTGTLVWSHLTGNVVYSTPMIANGVVYVGSYDGYLYALNAATGAQIWAFNAGASVSASPALAGGLICFGSSNMMYGLYPSGSVAWSYGAGLATNSLSSAAVVGGAIVVGGTNGTVYSLSSGGALLWSTALPERSGIFAPLCVANGVVYVTDESNTYALDLNTGANLATLPVGSQYGGPAVVNGAVFIADAVSGAIARFTPNALLSNFVAPRPDPMQLRPHRLR
jgi:outer membrane protein assembly factor BamB